MWGSVPSPCTKVKKWPYAVYLLHMCRWFLCRVKACRTDRQTWMLFKSEFNDTKQASQPLSVNESACEADNNTISNRV